MLMQVKSATGYAELTTCIPPFILCQTMLPQSSGTLPGFTNNALKPGRSELGSFTGRLSALISTSKTVFGQVRQEFLDDSIIRKVVLWASPFYWYFRGLLKLFSFAPSSMEAHY